MVYYLQESQTRFLPGNFDFAQVSDVKAVSFMTDTSLAQPVPPPPAPGR